MCPSGAQHRRVKKNARRNAVRRARLLELLADYEIEHGYGHVQKFADAIGKSQSFVSQLKAGTKGIGDETAQIIEGAFKLPRGYLDRSDDALQPRDDQEAMFVATALALFRANDAETLGAVLSLLGKKSRGKNK